MWHQSTRVVVGAVARGEPQPPAAALGQREPDPAHAGQRGQVGEQAPGDVVDPGGPHQGEPEPREVSQRCPRLDRLPGRSALPTPRPARPHDRGARPPARASPGKSQWRGGREPGRHRSARRAAARAVPPSPSAPCSRSWWPSASARWRRWSPGASWSGWPSTPAAPPAAASRASGPTSRWPRSARCVCLFLCLWLVHRAAAPGRHPRGEAAAGAVAPALRIGTSGSGTSGSALAVGQAADELQPRPGVVDRGDLDVDEPELEAEVADPVLVEVADRAVGVACGLCAAFLGQQTQTMPAVEVRSNSVGSRLASAAYDVWKVRRHVRGARQPAHQLRAPPVSSPARSRRARRRAGRRGRP